MSYGPDPFDNFRRSASYVDRNLQVSQAGRSFRSAANEVPPSFGKSLFAPDCVVADAVAIEPVSAFSFPANREINREFGDFAPNSIPDASVLVIITPTWSKIP
jgi:hypothetical protein